MPRSRLFLFLGITIEEAAREHVVRAQKQVTDRLYGTRLQRHVRPTQPVQSHLPLLHLGEVDDSHQDAVQHQLSEATRPVAPQVLEVGRLGAFPDFQAPRSLWLGVEENSELQSLHWNLAARLDSVCPQLELNPPRPHLELARVGRMAPEQRHRLAQELKAEPKPKSFTWTAHEVCLIHFELTPHGPSYSPLSAAKLGGEPTDRQDV